jgi:hypothetical protein
MAQFALQWIVPVLFLSLLAIGGGRDRTHATGAYLVCASLTLATLVGLSKLQFGREFVGGVILYLLPLTLMFATCFPKAVRRHWYLAIAVGVPAYVIGLLIAVAGVVNLGLMEP